MTKKPKFIRNEGKYGDLHDIYELIEMGWIKKKYQRNSEYPKNM